MSVEIHKENITKAFGEYVKENSDLNERMLWMVQHFNEPAEEYKDRALKKDDWLWDDVTTPQVMVDKVEEALTVLKENITDFMWYLDDLAREKNNG